MNISNKTWGFSARALQAGQVSLILLWLLPMISGGLMLIGLGNASCWDDEASIAWSARTLIRTGRLSMWDGRNMYTDDDLTTYYDKYGDGNPPLEALVAAASFKILGVSDWSARLPFAFAAIFTVLFFVILLRYAIPASESFQVYSAAILALSPAFLLYGRNCRYYSLTMLFPVVLYFLYRRYIAKRRDSDLALLLILSIALFYAQYLSCAIFLSALAAVHLLFYRDTIKRKGCIKPLCALAIFLFTTIPYAFLNGGLTFLQLAKPEPWLPHHAKLLWWNLRDLNLHAILPWPAALGLAGYLRFEWQNRQKLNETEVQAFDLTLQFAVMVFVPILMLGLISPGDTIDAKIVDLRYQTVMIPWMAGLTGALLWYVHRRYPIAAFALFATILCSNALTLTPPFVGTYFPETHAFRWLLPNYIDEVTHPYPTAHEEVAEYLNENAQYNDTVTASPAFYNTPIAYYAGDKIRICCQLDRRSNFSPQTAEALHAPIMIEDNYPTWFVSYGSRPQSLGDMAYFSRPHIVAGRLVRHNFELVKILNVYWKQTNRPELPLHTFGPDKDFDPRIDGVFIFKAQPDFVVTDDHRPT